MKIRTFDVIFHTNPNLDLNKRLLHLYDKIDKIFVITNQIPNLSEDIEKKFVIYFDEKVIFDPLIVNNYFIKISQSVSAIPSDIFLFSTSDEFPILDYRKYENLLVSEPIIHRMEFEDFYKMGTFVFLFSHYQKNINLILDLLKKRDSLRSENYNLLNNGKIVSESKLKTKYKIIDCFIFNDELDILNLRLKLLNEYIDKFVIVESKQTHSGLSKPLFFESNKHNFSNYLEKIVHVVIDEFPKEMIYSPSETDVPENLHINWFRENFQRNEILKGLYSLDLNDDDFILISDLDEIPHPKMLGGFLNQIPNGEYGYQLQKWCIWDFDRYLNGFWPGTAAVKWKDLKRTTPQEIRKNRYNYSLYHTPINYGWHCSWFGGIDVVMKKLESFAHQELRNISREDVLNKMTMNLDIHGHQLVTESDGFNPPI